MAFTFELKTRDGDDAGTLRTSEANWQAGDVVIAPGNRRYRVTAVLPLPTIEEFVDGATVGLLEVAVIPTTHLAFFETIAALIPVLFLTLILEERVAPPAEDALDHVMPIVIAALLFVGEALALAVVYEGAGSRGDAIALGVITGFAAFLLLGDAVTGQLERIDDDRVRTRVRLSAAGMLVLVVIAILAIANGWR